MQSLAIPANADWARLAVEGTMAAAMAYIALGMRALRAELRLEIAKALDAVMEKSAAIFATDAECKLRMDLVEAQIRGSRMERRSRTN